MNQLSARARTLLEAARDVREPPLAVRERVRRRLGSSLARGAITGTALAAEAAIMSVKTAGAATTSTAGSLAAYFALGLAVGVGGVVVAQELSRSPQPVPAPVRVLASTSARTRLEVPRPVPAASLSPPSARRPAADEKVATAVGSSLAQETPYLEKAQLHLQNGRAKSALDILARYSAQFPDGVLAQEAGAARIIALCSLGREAQARGHLREFEERYRGSLLAPRLRQACARR